jgi:hypothetical protein
LSAKSRGRLDLRRLFAVSALCLLFPFNLVNPGIYNPPQLAGPDYVQVNDVKGCLHGTLSVNPVQTRIVYLIPSFTLTPYNNWLTSFYAFYMKHKYSAGQITTDLDMLQTKVIANATFDQLLSEQSIVQFLQSSAASRCGLVFGKNLGFTTDVKVDAGALFSGPSRNYDVVIIGHEEYVTRAEYNQLKQFVATGGLLIDMSGNSFWGMVNYTRSTGMETFVAGHGFRFNGEYAWRSDYEPFDAASAGWFGSTFYNGIWKIGGALVDTSSADGRALASVIQTREAFTDNTYPHDEVNYLRNFTQTEIIARFYVASFPDHGGLRYDFPILPVDSYSHDYKKGEVVCLCVFGENFILRDAGAQFFLIYAVAEDFGKV